MNATGIFTAVILKFGALLVMCSTSWSQHSLDPDPKVLSNALNSSAKAAEGARLVIETISIADATARVVKQISPEVKKGLQKYPSSSAFVQTQLVWSKESGGFHEVTALIIGYGTHRSEFVEGKFFRNDRKYYSSKRQFVFRLSSQGELIYYTEEYDPLLNSFLENQFGKPNFLLAHTLLPKLKFDPSYYLYKRFFSQLPPSSFVMKAAPAPAPVPSESAIDGSSSRAQRAHEKAEREKTEAAANRASQESRAQEQADTYKRDAATADRDREKLQKEKSTKEKSPKEQPIRDLGPAIGPSPTIRGPFH
ncbi:MAG: hypothetical protein ACAI35_13380 [Candidatus Methylacidiphilales bacterium]